MGHLSDYLKSHESMDGLSNKQFAKRVGIGSSTADAILGGRSVPEDRTLRKIAVAFPGMQLETLRKKALLDTPFELPEGAELLDLEQRGLVRGVIKQFMRTAGIEDHMPQPDAQKREAAGGNVVELPRPQHVQRAAYDPSDDE